MTTTDRGDFATFLDGLLHEPPSPPPPPVVESATHTYRNHGGVWYLYDGRQCVWCDHDRGKLLAWAKAKGIVPRHDPLRIVRVV